jgi:hypothetical protein
MKNLNSIQTFLTELGIGNYWNGTELELAELGVNNVGGKDELLDAVTSTFGKGFRISLSAAGNGGYNLISIY